MRNQTKKIYKARNNALRLLQYLTISLIISETLSLFPRCPLGCKTCDKPEKESKDSKNTTDTKKNDKANSGEIEQKKPSNCFSCKKTFHLTGNSCLRCIIPDCDVCDDSRTKCIECTNQYFKKINVTTHESECKKCPENCVHCSSKTTCSQCLLGMTFSKKENLCSFNKNYLIGFGCFLLLFSFCLGYNCKSICGCLYRFFVPVSDDKHEENEGKKKKKKKIGSKVKSERVIKKIIKGEELPESARRFKTFVEKGKEGKEMDKIEKDLESKLAQRSDLGTTEGRPTTH